MGRWPRVDLNRRDLLRAAGAASVGLVTGVAAHGYLYDRHRIELTRETLPVSGLPPGLAGLRVGFMSDLHRSQTVPHELVERAVKLLLAETPDLIVLGGDYVTNFDR